MKLSSIQAVEMAYWRCIQVMRPDMVRYDEVKLRMEVFESAPERIGKRDYSGTPTSSRGIQ